MKRFVAYAISLFPLVCATNMAAGQSTAEVRAWTDTVNIPTYTWEDDINPKFWALQGDGRLPASTRGEIIYPYVMQDHISRNKVDQSYKALFLENEYLRVTCLPELGGRLHSVFDKTEGKEMFHFNGVIKPGMIAMRGAWISGGVEWNHGPHGHTVTAVSPVNALTGHNPDGSAWLEISNQEQIFRTRWTVRVTLHPGRAYLDEQICLSNPTDGMHPYYFWNCTAFPNGPGTRFIYPMTLGTDHNAREFFRWPVHEGRDLSWLKNYPRYSSIFAVDCSFDFFGACDAESGRGIVQVGNRHVLPGKKAWTWGEWQFGRMAESNLADDEGHYIEVQTGPLPTQSDYGMLAPRQRIAWQEWWYPVHGLGDGFEFATRDLAARTSRQDGRLELRLLATGQFPQATCTLKRDGRQVARQTLDLSPRSPSVVTLEDGASKPVDVTVTGKDGEILAEFTTPLPIPVVEPPNLPAEPADEDMSVEQLYLKGRKLDRETNRLKAREYYEKALAKDPGHIHSLRALAVLDFESGLYDKAVERLGTALRRDGDDGLCHYYLGVCHLRLGRFEQALHHGYQAVRCKGTVAIGHDLVGRARMRLGEGAAAVMAFEQAVKANNEDPVAADHLMSAFNAAGRTRESRALAATRVEKDPAALVPRAILALDGATSLADFARQARSFLGEDDFELLEASLVFAALGLFEDASRILREACVSVVPPEERSFMPLYYLAWYSSQAGNEPAARRWLAEAAKTRRDRVFASRPEEVEILRYATTAGPGDAQAHLQLGCLLANLGRVDEALPQWQKAADLDASLSIAWRNLGLAAASEKDLAKADAFYRRAIAARRDDQTLFRDLAEILIAADRRSDAIRLLEEMPLERIRRAEITLILAESYVAEERYGDCVSLLEKTPYFVNWEGQDVTWKLFNRAHIGRGQERLKNGDAEGALADFEAALTYPANLNVGRPDKPEEAPAQYWRGQALAGLGRTDEARGAWKAGANGADLAGRQNEYRRKCREALEGSKK
jgi:tetratricopeptide (TPR) repeat protein